MLGRGDPAFVAFDVRALEGRDLRELDGAQENPSPPHPAPLVVLFADFIEARGCDFYRLVCGRDLEGIVAKWKEAPYRADAPLSSWLKIKNPDYSQARDRAELFQR